MRATASLYGHGSGTLATSTTSPERVFGNKKLQASRVRPWLPHVNCMQRNDNSTTALYATPLSKLPPQPSAPATVSRPRDQKWRPFHAEPRKSKRAPLLPEPSRVRPCHGCVPLETKSDNPFHAQPRASKSARPYRQSPLKYAPATVSRPLRPKVTTLPQRTAGVQKRAPPPPEPSE